jgi:hypothetical protein
MLQTTKQDRLRTLSVHFGTPSPTAFERPFWLTLEKVNYSGLTYLKLTFSLSRNDQSDLNQPNALANFLQRLPSLQMLYLRHRMLKERQCLADLVTAFRKLNDLRAIGLEPLEPCDSRILRNVDPSLTSGKGRKTGCDFTSTKMKRHANPFYRPMRRLNGI